jgi:hypothetical protein
VTRTESSSRRLWAQSGNRYDPRTDYRGYPISADIPGLKIVDAAKIPAYRSVINMAPLTCPNAGGGQAVCRVVPLVRARYRRRRGRTGLIITEGTWTSPVNSLQTAGISPGSRSPDGSRVDAVHTEGGVIVVRRIMHERDASEVNGEVSPQSLGVR